MFIPQWHWSIFLPETTLVLYLVAKTRKQDKTPLPSFAEKNTGGNPGTTWLALVFALFLVIALVLMVLIVVSTPHGRWDSWWIWNLRARSLFRSTDGWEYTFSPLLNHTDYPLLLPLNVTLGWLALGSDSTLVPACFALLFTCFTAGLLTFSLAALGASHRGYTAGIILLGTPCFVFLGADQIADIPMSFYVLSCLVLLHLADRVVAQRFRLLMLAGFAAGLAAWTKNEGLLFLPAVMTSRIFVHNQSIRNYLRTMSRFVIGLFPALFVVFWFKLSLSPGNDLWAGRSLPEMISQLTDIDRYLQVGIAFGKVLYGFNYWPTLSLNVLLLCYAMITGICWRKITEELRWSFVTLFIMFTGYFFVFILTPHDLTWHLNTALERLFIQFYPYALLLYFLLLQKNTGTIHSDNKLQQTNPCMS